MWLPSTEARACGDLGEIEGAQDAIRRAAEIRDVVRPGTLDQFGGQMAFTRAKQHFYAASAFLGTGNDSVAIAQADETIESYASGPAEGYSYIDTTIARFQVAIAHVRSGELDAAVETARTALAIAPEYRSAQIESFAKRLHHQLRAIGIHNAPLAIQTRDQIEDFLSATSARPELS